MNGKDNQNMNNGAAENNDKENLPSGLRSSILDTMLGAEQLNQLQNFNAQEILNSMLESIDERSRHILKRRYGLEQYDASTLEAIGQELNLTRERIRQIEKDSINKLREKQTHPQLKMAHELLTNVLNDHGSVMHEDELIITLLMSGKTREQEAAVRFILELEESFEKLRHDDYHPSWYLKGFNLSLLHEMIAEMEQVLKDHGTVIEHDHLLGKVKNREHYNQNKHFYTEKALHNYVIISKKIKANPFGKIGLASWSSITPKDVGDKAYLVMKNHGQPEHYSQITELINKADFDSKTAYKETVHNELIKDKRFVLVGRGIYALKEWGYKPGIVADVIEDILKKAERPMSRDEIVDEVLKQRMVKRNTVLVGLSNKKRFKKVDKDKYTLSS